MSDPFIGQVTLFAGTYAPRGWAFCEGQLLPISEYPALFSILGTVYGGDGRTSFALPDLRGRTPLGAGTADGLSRAIEGVPYGAREVALTSNQIPSHNHEVSVNDTAAATPPPAAGNYPSAGGGAWADDAAATTMASSVGTTGAGEAFSVEQPILGIHYMIALEGTFPSRS